MHAEYGPLTTFLDVRDAKSERNAVYCDEPTWRGDLWIERFELLVAEPVRK